MSFGGSGSSSGSGLSGGWGLVGGWLGWHRSRPHRGKPIGIGFPAAGTAPPNNALHRIAVVRWSHDRRTRDYVARQLAAGRSKKDVLRLLKRAIAREMFRHLTAPCPIDDYCDLRPARQARNITLTARQNTSTFGQSRSPDSNAASNATTPSQPTTANG